MPRFIIAIFCFVFFQLFSNAQTLGGNTAFNFLKVPNTPQLTALGGINLTHQSNDIGLSFNNPALLRDSMHTQMNAVFNSFVGDIKIVSWMLGYHHQKLQTTFSFGVNYFNYGSISQTDAAGNIYGAFKPTDYVIQLGISRKYKERWHYGATIKYFSSNYGLYRSNGMAVDIGVNYYNPDAKFQAGLVAKNMGSQFKKYSSNNPEELPFDLQIGISKRLEKAPFQFSLTLQQIHRFDILYNDTIFNNDNFPDQNTIKTSTFSKLMQHIILATQIYLGDKVEFTIGYNHLRRSELSITNAPNGLNGISLGVGALLPKLHIRYARTYYQNNQAYNQIGITMPLNKYFGLGKFGERIGW